MSAVPGRRGGFGLGFGRGELSSALVDNLPRVGGNSGSIDVVSEIAQSDHFEPVLVEVAHVVAELFLRGVYPWMLVIRGSVELEHGDFAIPGLVDRALEVVEGPFGAGVAC